MKKAFSLALVLCMLLATVVIPTTAADPAQSAPIYNIPTDAETYTIDGVVYNVIRTADQFKAIDGTIAAPVNYILACDIDLGGTTITGANCGVINRKWKSGILEGNGFAIYGYQGNDVNNGALFAFPWDKTSHVFKNVSFGKSGNEIVMTTSGNGSCAAVIGKIYQDSSAAFYNCKAYVNFTDSDPSATKGQKGAFIGCSNRGNTSVYFENCETYGTISGSYGIGGYYGNINKDHTGLTFTFINCVNNVNLTATNEVGGFFGGNTTNVVDAQFTFVNCVNNGTLSIGSGKPKGDLIGKSVSTVPVNVTVPVSEAASLNDGAFGSIAAYPNVTLMANGDGTASAGWQKTTADDNGKVKVRMIVAVAEQYLSEVDTMTFTGTFGLTAGGSKTLTMTLGGDKPVKYYSSVVAAGETLAAAEGYVLIPVVVENIPEADWDGTVSMKLTATGSDNVVAYYQYN